MGVDQAGQQRALAEVGEVRVARQQRAVRGDLLDPPVADQHVGGALTVGEDHATGTDHRRRLLHQDLRTGLLYGWLGA
ncbi:hypothetical protein GCM10009665_28980 [Kitasatospora nipponensis]|uniref:Uncharacterized protein n=1 Tax=Kitasatospora nipponensis TaxID=258049 RepID=A0ABN1WA16_9ACTN